jgi:hypothetical protein
MSLAEFVCVCVCSLSYRTWNAHAPYFHLWHARLYIILPHCPINGMILDKANYWSQNVCFDFSLQLLSETFLVLRRNDRDMIKTYTGPHVKYPLFLSDFNHHHHHIHQGLGHSARSVSRVTAALANVSSVSRLFSFLVDCSSTILKGFGFVALFAGVKAISFCIHLSCLVCIQSAVHGVWSRLFYGH